MLFLLSKAGSNLLNRFRQAIPQSSFSLPDGYMGTDIANALNRVPNSETARSTIGSIGKVLIGLEDDLTNIRYQVQNLNPYQTPENIRKAYQKIDKSIAPLASTLMSTIPIIQNAKKFSDLSALPSSELFSAFSDVFTPMFKLMMSGVSLNDLIPNTLSSIGSIFPAMLNDVMRSPDEFRSMASRYALGFVVGPETANLIM